MYTEEFGDLDLEAYRGVAPQHCNTTGLNLCTKQNFRDFFVAKVFFWTQNSKSENFMQSEWSEEKLLKGSVGHQTKLSREMLLKQASNDRYFAHAAGKL